jgi:phage terminase large subunit-like protein
VAKKKSLTRSQRAIEWIEKYLRVPDGKMIGKPLLLREWQKDILRGIYDTPTRMAVISFPRKNGKSALTACFLLLHLCGPEARPNSQLYSAARSRRQSAVVFELAAKMVRLNPDLHGVVRVRDTAKELVCPDLGTLYHALSAEASTAHGTSPIFLCHDELGQVRGPRDQLFEALETGTGAHDDPLSIVISTQAASDNDLLSNLIDQARTGADPKMKLFFWGADLDDDPYCEATIRKANPAYGDFLNASTILDYMESAKRSPSSEPSYRNLHLNQRIEENSPFVSRSLWKSCDADPIEDFEGLDVYAGLDLSSTQDLTAFVRIAWHEGKYHVRPTFWLPEYDLREKAMRDRVAYDVWNKQSFLETTPGKAIEYEYVAHLIFQEHRKNPFRKIAFDRWNMKHLKPWLLKAGFLEEEIEGDAAVFEEFGQGFQSMSPALRTLETLILNGQIAHGGHPVLTWCAANATVQTDPSGGRKLSKSKSHGRIDGMQALAMAAGVAGSHVAGPSGISFWEAA